MLIDLTSAEEKMMDYTALVKVALNYVGGGDFSPLVWIMTPYVFQRYANDFYRPSHWTTDQKQRYMHFLKDYQHFLKKKVRSMSEQSQSQYYSVRSNWDKQYVKTQLRRLKLKKMNEHWFSEHNKYIFQSVTSIRFHEKIEEERTIPGREEPVESSGYLCCTIL